MVGPSPESGPGSAVEEGRGRRSFSGPLSAGVGAAMAPAKIRAQKMCSHFNMKNLFFQNSYMLVENVLSPSFILCRTIFLIILWLNHMAPELAH